MGVPARLGRDGISEVVELDLAPGEVEALRTAAEAVRGKQQEALGLLS